MGRRGKTLVQRHPEDAFPELRGVEVGERTTFDGASEAIWRGIGRPEFLDSRVTVTAWIRTEEDGRSSRRRTGRPMDPDGKTFFIRGAACYDVSWVGAVVATPT